MTSSHSTKLLLATLLALVLAAPALANIDINHYDHHQNLQTQHEEIYACSCASTVNYHEVTNYGDFAATFDFTLQAAMDWVELHQTQARLQPGESIQLAVTINPPCGLEQDPTYEITSTSQYGRYAVAQTAVTATVCESLSFNVEQHDNNILPCTEASFSLNVQNTAPHPETYTLSTDDENVRINQEELTLQPDAQASIPATAHYSCDVSGEQAITFKAQAHNTQSTHEQTKLLTIQEDYDFYLRATEQTSTNFCAETPSEKQLEITNLADTQNTYELRHQGPAFAQLNQQRVALQPGETKTVSLQLDADKPTGSHTSTITATTDYGANQQQLTLNYDTRNCYERAITVTPDEQTVCAGEAHYTVRVENRGETTETYTLIPEGAVFSQATPNEFELRPGEHAQATLTASVPDQNQDYTIELLVKQTPGLQEQVEIPLTGVSNVACTDVALEENKFTLYRDQNVIPLLITNQGIRATSYELSLESDAVTLEEDEVFLAAGEQAVLHLHAQDLEALADGQYLAQLTLISDRAEYRRDVHVTVKDKGLFTRAYEQVMYGREGYTDWCAALLILLGALALLLFVAWLLIQQTGATLNLPEHVQPVLRTLLLALAAILLVLAAISAFGVTTPSEFVDEPRGTNYSELYHELPQNQRYDLDLSRYFFDPDGDPLEYAHSQPSNLHIEVVDDVARITPTRGYSGTSNVVFTAIDSAGATVDSPVMQVRVLELKPTTAWEWIQAYCTPINYVLAALIALLLLALISASHGSRKDEKNPLVAFAKPSRASKSELVEPETQSGVTPAASGTQVGGDVVAGDKVTYVGANKPQVLVGSTGGKKVHRRTCATVDRISKEKRVTFSSEKEAIEAGYSGCKMCQSFSD